MDAVRNLFVVILLIAGLSSQTPTGPRPEWDDPAVLQIGTVKPHASMTIYPSAALAKRGDRARSPWYRSLNGQWKFHYAPSPASRPAAFSQAGFDDSKWSRIRVPASWETQGFGMPIFVNIGYAFPYDRQNPRPPRDDNPVGSYRRAFTIPAEWSGRRVFLTFDGVADRKSVV